MRKAQGHARARFAPETGASAAGVLVLLFLLVDNAFAAGDKRISWNPGHWVKYTVTTDQPSGVRNHTPQHKQQMASYLRSKWCKSYDGYNLHEGVELLVHWRNIEYGNRGSYNFAVIDDWLDAVQRRCGNGNRRLLIVLKVEAENQYYAQPAAVGGKACAPQWVWDRKKVVVDAKTAKNGQCVAAIWDPEVGDGFNDAAIALARRVNNQPLVEGVIVGGEESKGWVARVADRKGFDAGRWLIAKKNAVLAIRANASNKLVGFGTNHHKSYKAAWEQHVLGTCQNLAGCMLLWPDTLSRADAKTAHTTAHPQYCANSGRMGLFAGLQRPRKNFLPADTPRDPLEDVMDHCCNASRLPVDPAGRTDGYCATHTAWVPNGDPKIDALTIDATIRKLKEWNGAVYSKACPRNILANGYECATGRVP
jgi:hypothetical protein